MKKISFVMCCCFVMAACNDHNGSGTGADSNTAAGNDTSNSVGLPADLPSDSIRYDPTNSAASGTTGNSGNAGSAGTGNAAAGAVGSPGTPGSSNASSGYRTTDSAGNLRNPKSTTGAPGKK